MKKVFFILFLTIPIFAVLRCKSVEIGGTNPPTMDTTHYTCAGKTQCTEMVSCNEAKFYLKNCPDVNIDGDGDGIPCEDQWCHN